MLSLVGVWFVQACEFSSDAASLSLFPSLPHIPLHVQTDPSIGQTWQNVATS